jgi:hypothetical protein
VGTSVSEVAEEDADADVSAFERDPLGLRDSDMLLQTLWST